MRISCWKETGALHEMLREAEEGEMLARAEANGIDPSLLVEEEITIEEYRRRFDPVTVVDPALALAQQIRGERETRIKAVRWRIERHDDEVRMGLVPSEPVEPILTYIQALRDIPNQPGFPSNVLWPTVP